ncbi:CvpA family protein [Alistipes onderdonkii]|nr:CvpA family protein [Alistipes onderdonkii]
MNTIDLIVCLMLVLAVWNGWRQGFVMQVCSLAGIIAGIWVASRYGAEVGAWLKLDETISAAGGFVVVLLAVVLSTAVCNEPSCDSRVAILPVVNSSRRSLSLSMSSS